MKKKLRLIRVTNAIKEKKFRKALSEFYAIMEERLAEKEKNGFKGWDKDIYLYDIIDRMVRKARGCKLTMDINAREATYGNKLIELEAIDIAALAFMLHGLMVERRKKTSSLIADTKEVRIVE